MARPPDSGLTEPPLRPVVFSILLTLTQSQRHGYAIMQEVNDRMEARAILGPGTLYRTLKELRDRGLIQHAKAPDGEDARRQYYRLTADGRRVAAAEATRMSALVAEARAGQLISGKGTAG